MREAALELSPTGGLFEDVVSYGNLIDEDASRHNREATLRAEINRLLRPDCTRRLLQACTDAIVDNLNVVFARMGDA